MARGQVAADGECIRLLGTLTASIGVNNYAFSAINTGTSSSNGIAGTLSVRAIRYASGTGTAWITPRTWDWFQEINLNNPVVVNGAPTTWTQFGQGSAPTGSSSSAIVNSTGGGSFYLDPPPDSTYSLTLDCVCFPIALTNDSTPEAIPYLWTDAVPFLAAYYALLSAQMQARRADAEAYYNYYMTYVAKMRKLSQPSVNRFTYEQTLIDLASGAASQQQRSAQ